MKKEINNLRKDKDWKLLESKLCLVTDFSPIGSKVVKEEVISPDKSLPYGQIKLRCIGFEDEITGFITHKIDFYNLWTLYKERGVKEGEEEVLIYWTTNHYKSKIGKLLSLTLPKMVIIVCPIGTYKNNKGFDLENNIDLMVNVYGLLPISYCVPDVMK